MRTPKLLLWLLAAVALSFGCDNSTHSDTDTNTNTPTSEAADWPGGSLGDWEDGEGVEESWQHSGGGESGEDGALAGSRDDDYAEGEPSAGAMDEDGDIGAPPNDQGAGLEGGEIDDNAHFEAFLEYAAEAVERFAQDPMVHWIDVSERHIVTVKDPVGRAAPDTKVSVYDGQGELITWGRTRADGRFAFFPAAYTGAEGPYTVTAAIGEAEGEAALDGDAIIQLDAQPPAAPFQVDVAFVVDATGSMGGEIARIKSTITEIASQVAQSQFQPDLRFALVEYRDHGDAFVTHTVNFTHDVQAFQAAVDGLEANGGGDFPEALNEALHETMRHLEWRQTPTLRLTFVVADAPAHHYEQAPYTYDQAMRDAATMGVKIFPIASGGSDGVAELQFRQLAQFTLGHFIFITEGGGGSHGSEGSEYEVDPNTFDVEALDGLVVRLISEEMTAWHAPPAR